MDTSHACAARTATKWRGKTYYTPHYTHTRTLMQICSKFYGQACNASKPDVLNSNYGNRICASSHLFIIMLHLHLFNKTEREGEGARERCKGLPGCLAHGCNQLTAQLLAYLIVLRQRDQVEFLASIQAMIVQLLAVDDVPVCTEWERKQEKK